MSSPTPWAGRRLHFVGIGGAGMSGLALVAKALGAEVTGSDRAPGSPYAAPLLAAGIVPAAGHDAANVPAGAEVIVSTAIPPDNPERAAAREHGLVERHRADLLGEITRLRPTIAVTGTHGKTTTASMVVHALRGCGMDPGYLVGGAVRSTGSNAGWGTGEWLVVEADESDRSLLHLTPAIAVLTNAELDHHTTYASRRDVDATFAAFLALAAPARRVVWDRPELRALAGPEAVTFDVAVPELGPDGSRFAFDGVTVRLGVPGAHNARNAAAALTACRLAGADLIAAARRSRTSPAPGAASSASARRPRARWSSTTTPTTRPRCGRRIEAARTLAPRRVLAVFQPHLYSRTQREAPGVRRGAGARGRRRRRRRLPVPRARRGLPRRQRAPRGARGRGRRRRAPGGLDAGLRRR